MSEQSKAEKMWGLEMTLENAIELASRANERHSRGLAYIAVDSHHSAIYGHIKKPVLDEASGRWGITAGTVEFLGFYNGTELWSKTLREVPQ